MKGTYKADIWNLGNAGLAQAAVDPKCKNAKEVGALLARRQKEQTAREEAERIRAKVEQTRREAARAELLDNPFDPRRESIRRRPSYLRTHSQTPVDHLRAVACGAGYSFCDSQIVSG